MSPEARGALRETGLQAFELLGLPLIGTGVGAFDVAKLCWLPQPAEVTALCQSNSDQIISAARLFARQLDMVPSVPAVDAVSIVLGVVDLATDLFRGEIETREAVLDGSSLLARSLATLAEHCGRTGLKHAALGVALLLQAGKTGYLLKVAPALRLL